MKEPYDLLYAVFEGIYACFISIYLCFRTGENYFESASYLNFILHIVGVAYWVFRCYFNYDSYSLFEVLIGLHGGVLAYILKKHFTRIGGAILVPG